MPPTPPGFEPFSSSHSSSSDEEGNEQQQQEDSAMSNPKISKSYPAKSPENPLPLFRPSLGPDPSIKPMDETPKSKLKNPTPETERRKRKILEEEDHISGGGPSEKKLFQRVWTEEDEISLLEGMLEYRFKNGSYPSTREDFDFFHGFVQFSLQNEYTKTQIYDKIRRLRRKYNNSSIKNKKMGIQSSSENNEPTLYRLFNKIWGSDENGNGNKGGDDTAKDDALAIMASLAEIPDIGGGEKGEGNEGILYPTLNEIVTLLEIEHANSSMRGAFRRAMKSLKPSERRELEKKWARQCDSEMQLCMRREKLKEEMIGKFRDVLNNVS